jgi:hypothetical protein
MGLEDFWHPDKNGVRLMTYNGNARITAINDTIQNSDFLLSEACACDGAGVLTLQHSRELDGYPAIRSAAIDPRPFAGVRPSHHSRARP